MVGPTSVSPKKSARMGAPARGELLVEDDVLDHRQTLAAVLCRPGRADPAALEELVGPGPLELGSLLGGHGEPLVEPARPAGSPPATPGSPCGTARPRADRSDPSRPSLRLPVTATQPHAATVGGSSRSPGSSSSSPRPGPSCASRGRSDPSSSSLVWVVPRCCSCGSTGRRRGCVGPRSTGPGRRVGFAVLVAAVGLIAYPMLRRARVDRGRE